MADNVVEYILRINAKKGTAELKDLSGDLKKTQKELKKTGTRGAVAMQKLAIGAKKAQAAIGAMKTGLTSLGIAATAAGAGILAMAKQQADYVNAIVDTSARTGIAVKTLAGLKLAAESSGIAFSSIETALNGFIPKLTEAMEKTSRTRKFFDALGVSVDDGKGSLRDTNKVFEETIKSLSQIENSATKSAFAYQIFGQEAGAAFVQSGAIDNLDEFRQKAEKIGPALDENAIKRAQQFQIGWAQVKTSSLKAIEVMMEKITGKAGLGESLQVLAQDLIVWGEQLGNFFAKIQNIFGKIKKTVEFEIPEKFKNEINKYGSIEGLKEQKKQIEVNISVLENLNFGEYKIAEMRDSLLLLQEAIDYMEEKNAKESTTEGKIAGFFTPDKTAKIVKTKIKTDPIIPGSIETDEDQENQQKAIDETVKKYDDFIKKMESLDKAYKVLNKSIDSGNVNLDSATEKAKDLIDQYDKLGYHAPDYVQELIDKINKLKKEAEEAAKATAKIAAKVQGLEGISLGIDIAGGNIAGGMAGIANMLAPQFAPIANEIAGIMDGLVSLGSRLIDAEKQAMDQHVQELAAHQERILGRGLTEQEIQAIEDGLSKAEIARIKEEARMQSNKDLIWGFHDALIAGINELPAILNEVLPPMLHSLAISLMESLALLPYKFAYHAILGLREIFDVYFGRIIDLLDKIANPGETIRELGSKGSHMLNRLSFGLLGEEKRGGGRFITARSGIRYTGTSDGLAQLHRNEFVVSESGARPQGIERIMQRQSGGGVNININADIVERNAINELIEKIERQYLSFGTSTSPLFG